MLFVLKLIKNGVTELLETSSASTEDSSSINRANNGRSGSPARLSSAGGRDRPRSVSRGRTPAPCAAGVAGKDSKGEGKEEMEMEMEGVGKDEVSCEKEEGMAKSKENKDQRNAVKTGGKKAEQEMDDETLEAAVRDLRTCMELVMKRLDIGLAPMPALA
jgi:hypothetical protein